ncbi:MAG: hypothetical protein EOP04_03335 [Proteobacteria bacterium]|nr:MAG: hypothetical protein EOP04_03335 [Pseudomonadota bacterium]
MKALLTLALLSTVSSAAFSSDYVKANDYSCQIKGNTKAIITLATESFTGEPQLFISGLESYREHWSTTDLIKTAVGWQATANVEYLSDATKTYTLFVPETMVKPATPFPVKGLLIITDAGGIMDPEMLEGPIQQNTHLELECKANFLNS